MTSHLTANATHKVFVLHGWANTKLIMTKVCKDLDRAGFDYINYHYPSFKEELDSLGKNLYLEVKKQKIDSVSFVTFSMGGLVFRNMLKYAYQDDDFPNIFRVVMIAPPNQGADIADFFKNSELFHKFLGPNVKPMETDSNSYVHTLPIPKNCNVGVIVGTRKNPHGFNPFIEGDNDGLIKPEHTLLGNETDVIIFKLNHLALVNRKKSRKMVVKFLQKGYFNEKNK